jgi:hypothetical protein
MSAKIDVVGQRFGRLVVLENAKDEKGRYRLRCKCDCGAEKLVVSSNLRRGFTKSCGSCSISVKAPSQETTFQTLDLLRELYRCLVQAGWAPPTVFRCQTPPCIGSIQG